MCGVATTLRSRARCGDGIWSGARPTSMAQPAIRPSLSAASSAASSIRLPRDTLIRYAPLHPAQLRDADQVLGLCRGNGEHHDEIGLGQERAEIGPGQLRPRHLDVRIADQHAHAERHAELGKTPADLAVADRAKRAAAQLAHARRGAGARTIGDRGRRDAAREVDHEADRELGHRVDEAGARAGHQHAARRGGARTSTLRMSTAQRTKATGRAAARTPPPAPR